MRWVFLVLLAVLSPVRGQDNLVNERLPADRPALERHWGVDCRAAVEEVRAGVSVAQACPVSPLSRERAAAVARDLARCALLDRREATGPGPHQRLAEAFQRWRCALGAGRVPECKVARDVVKDLLETEFDLGQGP